MTFMNNLWRDLLEKRLWPVAVALLVALVAVPLVLAAGGSDTPGPVSTPAVAPAGSPGIDSAAQVSLDTTTSSAAKDRAGAVHNPFKPLHTIKPPATASAAAGPAGPAGPAGATAIPPVSQSGASTTAPSTATHVPSTSAPKSSGSTTHKVVPLEWVVGVRLGSHTAMKTYSGVRGITFLPSPDYALLTYFGVKRDLKTVVFAVAPQTLVSGDGTCHPSPARCNLLELKRGDSALLTRRAGATQLKRYRVRVLSLKLRRMASKGAKASAAKAGLSVDTSMLAARAG